MTGMSSMITNATQVTGWRRSTKCDNSGPNCVEVASHAGGVALRDSKNPTGPALMFTGSEIGAFLEAVKHGEFDDLAN